MNRNFVGCAIYTLKIHIGKKVTLLQTCQIDSDELNRYFGVRFTGPVHDGFHRLPCRPCLSIRPLEHPRAPIPRLFAVMYKAHDPCPVTELVQRRQHIPLISPCEGASPLLYQHPKLACRANEHGPPTALPSRPVVIWGSVLMAAGQSKYSALTNLHVAFSSPLGPLLAQINHLNELLSIFLQKKLHFHTNSPSSFLFFLSPECFLCLLFSVFGI